MCPLRSRRTAFFHSVCGSDGVVGGSLNVMSGCGRLAIIPKRDFQARGQERADLGVASEKVDSQPGQVKEEEETNSYQRPLMTPLYPLHYETMSEGTPASTPLLDLELGSGTGSPPRLAS